MDSLSRTYCENKAIVHSFTRKANLCLSAVTVVGVAALYSGYNTFNTVGVIKSSSIGAALCAGVAWLSAGEPREGLQQRKELSETRREEEGDHDGAITRIMDVCVTAGKILDLRGFGIRSLPSAIDRLTSLEKIFLTGNQMEALPETIGNLTNLKELAIDFNNTQSLFRNKLTTIPDSIGKLKNLEKLKLAGNKLERLPETIGQLTKLTKLDLSRNPISSLPTTIGNLENLEVLILDGNTTLTKIPYSITSGLRSLKKLSLSDNYSLCPPIAFANYPDLAIKRGFQLNSLLCHGLEAIQYAQQQSKQGVQVDLQSHKTLLDRYSNGGYDISGMLANDKLEVGEQTAYIRWMELLNADSCVTLEEAEQAVGESLLERLANSSENRHEKISLNSELEQPES